MSESHCQDAAVNLAKAIEPLLRVAVFKVARDNAVWVGKRVLGLEERNVVFGEIRRRLCFVPLELRLRCACRLTHGHINGHT